MNLTLIVMILDLSDFLLGTAELNIQPSIFTLVHQRRLEKKLETHKQTIPIYPCIVSP